MNKTLSQILDEKSLDQALAEGSDILSVCRTALKHGRGVLRQMYEDKSRRTEQLVVDHAWLVDQIITRVWQHKIDASITSETCLIAVGGYGRAELHPWSDVDILVLLPQDKSTPGKALELFIQVLWDIGLDIGHSVRSLKECIKQARIDVSTMTNLLEARLLYGNESLFAELKKNIYSRQTWDPAKFYEAKRKEQQDRYERYGETAYKLEPNLKESPGGLRDIQNILWIAQRYLRVHTFPDLAEQGLISEEESATLHRCRNFLWNIRQGLHYLAGRHEDRLLFDHQRTLAVKMGYSDTDESLAVEKFMKKYYRTVREIAFLNEVLLQLFAEKLQKTEKKKPRSINRRFQARGGFLEVKNNSVFRNYPFALLEIFLLLQQQTKLNGVAANTIRLIRNNIGQINTEFRNDIRNRSLFMEILRQPSGITHELRRMNAYGVLGAYIPAFGKIVGQMQHDLFHTYTVDEHSLFVLRNLRRLTIPEFRNELPHASALIEHVAKPERLYLGALFHDIAKGRGGDHSELGEKEAEKFCKKHQLGEYDTRFVCWLVRHHLIMSWTAQRQDITDPEVIRDFASKVGDQEHLDNLYLLTIADIRGTSPVVWNDWKGYLLLQLYNATSRYLIQGGYGEKDLEETVKSRQQGALEIMGVKAEDSRLISLLWQQMDTSYFIYNDIDSIAWQAKTITTRSAADIPVVAARYRGDMGCTEVFIYTPDKSALFATLTGIIDRMHMSIVDARIHTSSHNFALDSFILLDQKGKPVRAARALASLEKDIQAEFVKTRKPPAARTGRLPRELKHFPLPTEVKFGHSPNEKFTIIEVSAQDRPGLLNQLALSLHQCKVRLHLAKISTYGERAEDIFFVTDLDHQPVNDSQQQEEIRKTILEHLDRETGPKGTSAREITV